MAMLAEKREKKCIRTFMLKSKPLTSDSCKVGQRLLEKMGWTPGKGLGVKEDGSPDPLRIKFKCDIKGLGFKENEKDALSCQEGFNDLLASLSQHNNSSHASHTNDEKDKALNSLEMVSKKSRARVHYQKFTRGKDLSQASSKDLASILGMSTEKVPEVITNKVQTSPLPSSLVHEVDGSSKRKRDKCFSSASAITEDADFNMESESINHKKKKKKKKLDCHNYEPSTFNNEKDTIDANSSPSGRRKSVTWGDVEVSYVSKYISDMIDTSSESFKEDDAAPTMLPENVSGVKTPTDEQSNKKKKKREVNNTDEGDNAILSNIDSKKLMSSENTCAGSGNPRDVSVSCLGERKKDKKKKKLRTNLEDVSDCKIFDSSSEISLKKQIPEDDGTDPIVMKKKQMKKKKQKEDNCGDNSGKAVETLDKGAVKSFSSEGTLLHSECLNGLLSKSKRKKRNSEEMNSSVITLSTEERASDFCRYSPEVMMNGIHNTNQNNVSSIKIKKKDKKKRKIREISQGLSIEVEESLKPSGKESFDELIALEEKIENRKKKEKRRVREKESGITFTTEAEICSTVPGNCDGNISISDSQGLNSSCVSFPTNHKRKSKKRTADENLICNGGTSGAGKESNDPVKDEEVSSLHMISSEVIKPLEDGEPLGVANNKPVLSLLTKEQMTKWKKRHKSSQSTTLDGAPNVENLTSETGASASPISAVQETSQALPSIDKRKRAKYHPEQLNELNFKGSNLDLIKGYGFPVAV